MKVWTGILLAVFLLCPVVVTAHHPAEDIVDEEIFAFIDDMVSDTPHATLDFDDMGSTVFMQIETDFVSTAEALIQQGLLSHVSLLDGDVTMTIDFAPAEEAGPLYSLTDKKADKRHSKWSEWGGKVVITIVQEK